jgi:hypothetical protein
MLSYNELETFLLESEFCNTWKRLILDKELYFKIKIRQSEIWLYYNGMHILTLKYYKSRNNMELQDRGEILEIRNIFEIVENQKMKYRKHGSQNESVYQYKLAALDKRIIDTELLDYYNVRADLVLIDESSNNILLIEMKKMDNKDFKTWKIQNQLERYNSYAMECKDKIIDDATKLLVFRKNIGLYDKIVSEKYNLVLKPLLFITNCNNVEIMNRHFKKYIDRLSSNICGVIYTNTLIKIDMQKIEEKKIQYEFRD